MNSWIDQIFSAGQASRGNIVRRSLRDVRKYSSFDELEREVRRRGFHLAIVGEQCVIVCNCDGMLKLVC